MRVTTVVLALAALLGVPGAADSPERWVPDHCLNDQAASVGGDPKPRWNDAYREGFRAIERGDYHAAQEQMCRALLAARESGPRDWRFAETLDELGLIAFELGDLDRAERMQGAAIAEMLLAVGPHGEPIGEHEASHAAAIRKDCRSGIRVYTTRLGWILERVPGRTTTAELLEAPWRIFAAEYVPLDAGLARRLDWLVSQYLLQEDLEAAEALTELQQEILD